MKKIRSWSLALSRLAASLALISSASGAWAAPWNFPSNVGLSVGGSVGVGTQGTAPFNTMFPMGGKYSYSIDAYNQKSYSPVTDNAVGSSWRQWRHGSSDPFFETASANSQAKADFGTLGVSAYSWVWDFPHNFVDGERYPDAPNVFNNGQWALLSVFSKASASFFDSWLPDSPMLPVGSIATLDVVIRLAGNLDQSSMYDAASLQLKLTDHTTGQSDQASPSSGIHTYVLSIPVVIGQRADYELNLEAVTVSGWAANDGTVLSGGGAMEVDFLHTATVDGITLRDSNGVAVTDFTLSALSGHDYLNAAPPPSGVPEPASLLLTLSALTGLALQRKASR